MKKDIYLSVIIPAYNEAKRIGATLLSLANYFKDKSYAYEIIIVDDGSSDGTSGVVLSFKKHFENFTLINNEKNKGKGYSVKHGMLNAKGVYRLFMDADNSVNIDNLDTFMSYCKNGYDIAIGSIKIKGSSIKESNGKYRRILGNISKILIRFIAVPCVYDTQRGFKLFSKEATDKIFQKQTIDRFGFDMELLTLAMLFGFKIKELPVKWDNPSGSKVTIFSYFSSFIELLRIKKNCFLGVYSEKNKYSGLVFSDIVYQVSLFLLSIVSLFLLILIKSKTAVEFKNDPLLFIYSIFVTIFVFSRLFSSLFYKYSLSKVNKNFNRGYEPLVSFVIPCKNEEKSISETIEKCFEADYPKEKLEVIIINDGSTDNTIGVLNRLKKKFEKLIIINWEINRGKRHGMYEGFKKAKGEIVVQLDSDSYIDPKTFINLIKPFQNPEIGAVCAHADPTNADENFITKIQSAYYFMSFRILKAAESAYLSVFCCSGCSSAYRKSVVLPILDDWLNENFLGKPVTWGDDRALTSWVLKKEHKIVYTDYVKAFTIVPNNVRQLLKQQLRWKKSWIINGIFTSRFIYKKHLFMALFYFFPLLAISFLTPFMVFKAMIYSPIIKGVFPVYYLLGYVLITSIIVIFYRLYARENKYWFHLYIWSFLNIIIFCYIIIYAAIRIQDRGWGTR